MDKFGTINISPKNDKERAVLFLSYFIIALELDPLKCWKIMGHEDDCKWGLYASICENIHIFSERKMNLLWKM